MDASEPATFDVVVLGSGVAGMAAALFSAIRGLSVVVVEKASVIGGTSALSAGTAWVPGTLHSAKVNRADSRENAERYLRAAIGNRLDPGKLDAFLTHGPAAIAKLQAETEVLFRPRPHHPDYLSDLPGSTLCGRALEPVPFDGRKLGADIRRLRPPLRVLTLFGMMAGADDIKHLLRAGRSMRSAVHAIKLLARYGSDRLRYRRGTRLLMGNALCARFLHSLNQRKVPIWTDCAASELILDENRVAGVAVQRHGQTTRILSRRGVVLATGGFAHSKRLQGLLLPQPVARSTAMPNEVSGDGIELGLKHGATLEHSYADGAFWSPISLHHKRDGTVAVYPHFFLDRGKPGVLAVNQAGHRFVNEATSYDGFVRGMYQANERSPSVPCYLIADTRAVRTYGFGLVLPGGRRVRRLLADGYLKRAGSVDELGRMLGIDARALVDSVERFNNQARAGRDADFHRGETAANLVLGDPAHQPNPCLGPLETAPFYAIELHPGMNGTSIALMTDDRGQVLDQAGTPIPGLFACGNDMTSMMAGVYPGPGVTIGPAIVFAHIVAAALSHGCAVQASGGNDDGTN